MDPAGVSLKLLPEAMVSEVWRTLSRIFRIGRARFIVGYDLNKNVYYELPSLYGDPKRTRRLIQWNKAIASVSYTHLTLPTKA